MAIGTSAVPNSSFTYDNSVVGATPSGVIDYRNLDLHVKNNRLLNNNNSFSTPPEFIPSSGSNNTGNIRPTQQTNSIYRGPPTSAAPRGGTRHVSMQPMFQQPIHQSVVMPSYQTFGPRQPAYQNPQYPYSQTIQQFYPYPFYSPMQQPPTHQRGAVGVNPGVSVNVGNALSVQQSLNGPPGTSQSQMSLTPGAVLSVPPCSNAVLGVASTGQQQVNVGMPSLVGVGVPVSGTVSSQTSQRKARRKHALDIIHPDTKRNIFEDIENVPTASEVENQEQLTTIPIISPDISMISTHPHPPELIVSSHNAPSVLPTDNRTIIYNMDMHQIQQQRELVGSQTPVVSAMSDAPSVEIRPTMQKTRIKKIISITSPKDETKSSSLGSTLSSTIFSVKHGSHRKNGRKTQANKKDSVT